MEEQLWFIDGYYMCAGRPKLEAWMMQTVRDKYLNRLIKEDDIPDFLKSLQNVAEAAWEQNKRQKKVEVRISGNALKLGTMRNHDDILFLYIGEQHLILKRVEGFLKRKEAQK